MMRRLNFTGRRRIPRAKVTVRLVPAAGGVWAFDADYDLGEFDFPPASRVYVEAYNATSYMRFAFGTVAKRETPADLRLAEITRSPLPKFRLTGGGRPPRAPARGGRQAPRRSGPRRTRRASSRCCRWSSPISASACGGSSSPTGRCWSSTAASPTWARPRARPTPFLALVYPEVVRQILHAVLFDEDQADPDFDASDWTSLWLRYACALPGVEAPPQGVGEEAAARKTQWIDQAVEAFCRARDARVRFERALGRGAL
ncbi:MAG: hypothetical protein M5U08_15385 [Burkholderiales bacterium]|nr:hypothetical protein [Burkholderiales bacterium]